MNEGDGVEAFERAVVETRPVWAIVLGSGLSGVFRDVEELGSCGYGEISGLPMSRVSGHAGRFVLARIAGQPVLLAQGRVHLYEGWNAKEVTAGVRYLCGLGIRRLVLTNAAGTINRGFAPGNWMAIADHLNLTGTSPLIGGANFVEMGEVYSRRLRERFLAAAKEENGRWHEGVYAGLIGPQYETPAEIRMLSALGADAVGMSTVLEAIQARALGLEVAGLSCLTNWAAGLSGEAISHEEVLEMGKVAAGEFARVFSRVVGGGEWK